MLFSGSKAVLRALDYIVLFLFFFVGCFIHVQICNVFGIKVLAAQVSILDFSPLLNRKLCWSEGETSYFNCMVP